ncbi:MAG: symmetrical bis(5'-nucleosyl)-tetraphosphatase [Myxococcales bacterium]|jgi:bis(5'-nucleosyl)-tetraphosphatase (symmetrical)|nr:symmetrical bis(5'-nucleosyl)-tetraphosphatase [Myxococcales bacterium]
MATYAVGDIHGCFDELQALLRRVDFCPGRDELWLTGDVVNRGPRSLDVLRWAKWHAGAVRLVLGNHDLHLVSCALGVGQGDSRDTIQEILSAPDVGELITWLRRQPLLIREGDFCLVHAGLDPAWTIEEAEARAREVEALLQTPRAAELLQRNSSDEALFRARSSVARLTRLRTCDSRGVQNERFIGPPSEVPPGERPWFDWPSPRDPGTTIVFGHWAALDVMLRPNLIALDSGCVWGRSLSALRLEDRALFQQPRHSGEHA